MVRSLAFLMLAAFTCAATIGCGNPGPPVVPENAPAYDGEQLTKESNTAQATIDD